MPFKPVEHPKCPKCGKSVYAAEEMSAGGYKWHKFCFKCTMCNKMLDSFSCAEHAAELFCRQCHVRRWGPKGVGFGIGGGALTMDSGERFGNTEVDMTSVVLMHVTYDNQNVYMCNKMLDSVTCAPHEAELYCKQCHGRKFGPKGVGFGLGAGALTMDDGARFGGSK